ncbi:MAG: energy-coupling factor transporter transmembrane protein EcfT [Chloroflexi bacterium]|nr:energy-coupling factor transporter transmembrane protein EcfT [Chloroflexota bacterium]
MRGIFHPLVWLLWFGSVLLPILWTRNPLYLSLIIGALLLNRWALQRPGDPTGWQRVIGWMLGLIPIAVLFNVLTVHYGQHVWARLPHTWPLIGGILTWEAVAFGLANGLRLMALILLFAVFYLDMPSARWLRLVPRAFFQAGLVTSIAVTFVPASVSAARDIYEAQRLRGHRFRRVTDYAPLLAPLVVDSLERSVQLAQALAIRGFGAEGSSSPRERLLGQGMLWIALLCFLGGMVTSLLRQSGQAVQGTCFLMGAVLWFLAMWLRSRGVKRTRYRTWLWRPRDTWLLLGSSILLLLTVGTALHAPERWFYYPYPPYDIWPNFTWIPGAFLPLIALPAVLAPSARPHRSPAPTRRKGHPTQQEVTS